MTATKLSTRFRELLRRPQLLVMSGGFSPLHAQMSEVLGYEAFFMSGSQVAAYVYGYPDVGLLGLNEMVEPTSKPVPPSNTLAERNPEQEPRPRPGRNSNGRAPGCTLMPPLPSSHRCSRSTDRGAAA